MSPEQAAQWISAHGLSLSANTIRRYCDAGILRCATTPTGHRRVPLAELRRLLAEAGFEAAAVA